MRHHFHLFTYGTLRRRVGAGSGTHPALAGCDIIDEATVRGTLYDLGAYPALILAGNDPVPGQVWRCPAVRLADLDRYEAVDEGLFRRVGVRIGDTACWVYVAGPRLATRLTADRRVSQPARTGGQPPADEPMSGAGEVASGTGESASPTAPSSRNSPTHRTDGPWRRSPG